LRDVAPRPSLSLAREFDEGGASFGFGFAAGTIFAAFL
jgi:hypothetical protein